MKNYIRATTLFMIVYFVGVIVFAFIITRPTRDKVDTVKLNDISRNVQDKWDSLQSLDSMDFGVSFVVIDNKDFVIYRSPNMKKDGNIRSIEDAIKRRYPYQNITVDGTVVGMVVMQDDISSELRAQNIKLIVSFVVCGLILLIGALGFGIYIRNNIIVPFDRMKDFAGKVAVGNLDEPLMMEQNNMFGVFTESFDIMREELAASRKRELELQRKEKELVASLSHDLKTPITGIKLTSELLQAKMEKYSASDEKVVSEMMESGAKDISEKLDNIYKKADQIDVLVSDLFSSTLEDLGEFKVKCDDEDSSVISDIIKKNDYNSLVNEADIPGVVIHIDIKRMNQVIGNILVNSYKYAGTKIDITYKLVEGYLEMRIQDYGPGVPKDELDLITNKFYRGKNSEESKAEGSGLGLYISRSLMEKMDGGLTCESEGKGLAVILLIPMS